MNSKTPDQTLDGNTWDGGADNSSLGAQLRRAREARGVTLREISEQTRITMRHLEAIEADDYKHLPGGIFNKSFVRAYARHVRFDEQRALELYARAAGEADEVLTSPQRSHIYMGDSPRSPLVTAGLSAIIVAVLILIVYAGLNYYRRTAGQTDAGAATPTPASAPAANPAAAQPAPPPAEGFQVQVRAKRRFWLTSWQDDEKKKRGRFVTPDKPEEFTPASSLNLHFERDAADAFEVSVNGQALRQPPDTTIWTITKDNYRQFLP